MIYQKLKKNLNELLIFVIFLFLLIPETKLHNDSLSYIENYFRRVPLYPLLIDITQFISSDNFLLFLKFLQLIIGYFSFLIFINHFKKYFELKNNIDYFLLSIIILIPYINPYSFLGSSVLSESLSYPLFLVYIATIFEFKNNPSIKNLIFNFIILTILILTRGTFTFLFIFNLILIILFIKEKFKYVFFVLIFSLISILISSNLTKSYLFIKHQSFTSSKVDGFSFIALPFYVSENKDIFENKNKQKIVEEVKTYLNKNNVNLNYIKNISSIRNLRKNLNNYYQVFIPIIHAFEYEVPKKIILDENEILNKELINKILKDMSFEYIKNNKYDYLKMYLLNFIYGSGGYFLEAENLKGFYANFGFSGLYFPLIIFLFLVVLVFKKIKYKIKLSQEYFLLSILLNFINISAISLYTPVYDRFSFYTFIFLIFTIYLNFSVKIKN